jgi:NADPH-dependent 2,4-dienoyl-CoA reductase/sulfur reductase-like enzyme
MLAPYFLKGIIPWEHCFPFGPGFYRTYDITCHFGAAAEALDVINHEVTLADEQKVAYSRCLIATGASPVIPAVPGLQGSPRTFLLRTAASARRLEEAIRSAGHALVLGASFVGLKVAEILTKRHIEVILLDVADQMLPHRAHPTSAAIMRTLFEGHGVDVRLGCTMDGMEGAGEGVACHFTGDVIKEVDFVVVCTGVRPNLDFVDPLQVQTDQAVLVDERLEASVRDLYAAGDASQGINMLSGTHEWLGTWENACLQGRIAGQAMAGRDASYPGSIPQNIGPLFEWTYAQLGDVQPQGNSVLHFAFGDPGKGGHLLLAFRQHILVGANLINCTRLAGKLRRAILQKWRWGDCLQHSFTVQGVERALNEAADDFRGTAKEHSRDAVEEGAWSRKEMGSRMLGIRCRR